MEVKQLRKISTRAARLHVRCGVTKTNSNLSAISGIDTGLEMSVSCTDAGWHRVVIRADDASIAPANPFYPSEAKLGLVPRLLRRLTFLDVSRELLLTSDCVAIHNDARWISRWWTRSIVNETVMIFRASGYVFFLEMHHWRWSSRAGSFGV